MSPLDSERWRAVSGDLGRLLELTGEERAARLEALRAERPEVAAELELLLAEHDAVVRERFLEDAPELPTPPGSFAGQPFGPYRLVSLVGQGGMGGVWLAERSDGRFTGRVAVKLLNAALIGRASEERFRREGSILARLTHPHIAHLIDAGVSPAGQPYLVLEHVQGDHIDRHCDERRLGIEARVRLFLDVLAAVEHAHARLIVHRDLKPSNVLVREDGCVKLLDFGIAKLLDGDGEAAGATLTVEGGRALTPEYAAPEQMTGGLVTTATDVYALGVLLYGLLSGQHPAGATARTPADLMKAIVETTPPRLSDTVAAAAQSPAQMAATAAKRGVTPDGLRRILRGDLETITARALKKAPQERYPSIGALADDLRRYLDHRPVRARPDTLAYRTRKFVRRNRVAVALATAAALALVGGLAGTITQARRATAQARIAETQRDFALRQLSRAEAANDLNQFLLSDAAPSGKPFTVGDLLVQAERIVERQQEGDENQVEMLIAIGRQYSVQDREDDARRVLTLAYDAARKLPDRTIEAKASCALASSIAEGGGEQPRAEGLFADALRLLPDEPQYVLDRVFCYLRGSEVARELGEPEQGVERAETANRLLQDGRLASPLRQLRASMELAESYRMAGRLAEAHRAFAEASARLAALGRDETETAGTLLNNWALVLTALGQPLEAHRLFRRAIAISSDDGTDERVSPMLLVNLARTLEDLHRPAEALAYAERGYTRARQIGNEIAVTLSLLARTIIHRQLGNLPAAGRALGELESRIRATMPAGHPLFTIVVWQQALLAQAAGDLETALARADRAAATAQAMFQPLLLTDRSRMALDAGRVDQARTDAERALALLTPAAGPPMPSYLVGRAHLALGRALLAQGAAADARRALTEAAAQLAPTVGPDHPDTRLASRLGGAEAVAAGSRPGSR